MASPLEAWMEQLKGVPVEPEEFFAGTDGVLGRRAAAARSKLTGALAPVLARALQPGERVRHVARGYRYYLGEYYFAGFAAYVHNRMALVLTDRRLLLLQVGGGGKAGDIKNQVRLAEVRGVRAPFIGAWRVDLADGTRLSFVGVARRDRKRLAALLPAAPRTAPAPRPAGAPGSVEHLCPACLAVVPGPVGTSLTCPEPACRIPFRDPRKAARLSALVPGLGDLYLRHHFFGALEFLGSMAMLGVAAMLALSLAFDGGGAAAIGAAMALLLVVVPRAIDHRITLHMGRKGLVPLALAPAPGAQARNLPSYPAWSPLLFAAGVALAGGVAWLGAGAARTDARLREAVALAEAGRHDEAMLSFQGLDASEQLDDSRRVRFALALQESGDLEGAQVVSSGFGGGQVDRALADRWNRAMERQRASLEALDEGFRALAGGDEEGAWPRLDRAIGALGKARRPHFPASRDEARLHVASALLAPPVGAAELQRAEALLAASRGGPAPEVAAVRSAIAGLRGDLPAARAGAGALDARAFPIEFRLLVLETRHRSAADAAERAAVAREAGEIDRDGIRDDLAARIDALQTR